MGTPARRPRGRLGAGSVRAPDVVELIPGIQDRIAPQPGVAVLGHAPHAVVVEVVVDVLVDRGGIVQMRGVERQPAEAVVDEARDGIAGVLFAIAVAIVIEIDGRGFAADAGGGR